MRQFFIKTEKHIFLNCMVGLLVFILPFYSMRVSLLSTSLSVLTVFCLFTSIFLFIYNYEHIIPLWKTNKLIFVFFIGFILSFLPSLLLHPSTHAYGVMLEWILCPAILGLLLSIHFTKFPQSRIFIHQIFVFFSLFFAIFALYYYLLDIITYDGRLSFIYLSPNHLAMFITPLIIIIFASISINRKTTYAITSLLTITLLCIILFLTQSLSSIIAMLIIAILGLIFFIKRRSLLIFTLIIVFLIGGMMGYQKIIHSNPDLHRNSIMSRVMILETAIFLIQKSPIYGYEIDSFQKHYLSSQPYFTPYLDWAVPTPHNLFLTFLFSGGFFSVLFFLLMSFFLLYNLILSFVKTHIHLYIIYTCALCVIIISGIFDTTYWKNDLACLFWIIFALSSSSIFNSPSQPEISL